MSKTLSLKYITLSQNKNLFLTVLFCFRYDVSYIRIPTYQRRWIRSRLSASFGRAMPEADLQ